MAETEQLLKKLIPGKVYRREDLQRYSSSVDRDLRNLVRQGALCKAIRGVYYVPRKTAFGQAPSDDKELVRAFLKDNHFLLTSPNAFHNLGVGTTQLYNQLVVYNHKRHGNYKLGNRIYSFRVKANFPMQANEVFLLVDLINNLNYLAENEEEVLEQVAKKAKEMDGPKLRAAIRQYANVRTQKLFSTFLKENS
jgi:hypothetical protein